MDSLGKILLIVGIVIVAIGLVLMLLPKVPFLGKLPGDFHWKKEHVEVYLPLATSLLVSVVVSGVLWLIQYFSKK
jgi:hypothetical protein